MCIRLAHDQRHWKTDGRGNRVSVNTNWERKADWHVTEGKGRQREEKSVCVGEESRLACDPRQGKTEGRKKVCV